MYLWFEGGEETVLTDGLLCCGSFDECFVDLAGVTYKFWHLFVVDIFLLYWIVIILKSIIMINEDMEWSVGEG